MLCTPWDKTNFSVLTFLSETTTKFAFFVFKFLNIKYRDTLISVLRRTDLLLYIYEDVSQWDTDLTANNGAKR